MLWVREMVPEEAEGIKRLAHARPEGARTVERARIIWLSSRGKRVSVIAEELRVGKDTVRQWIKRFNESGAEGLADLPRSGAPPTYTPEQVGEVVATSLTNPRTLDLPFASWTLDRLTAYLNEEKGIPIKRSRVGELLVAEGLRSPRLREAVTGRCFAPWRKQETWFGERVDPEFAEKRGPSRPSTPPRPRGAS